MRSVARITPRTFSRVITAIASRTLWCSVACAILRVAETQHHDRRRSRSVPVARATNDGWPSNVNAGERDRGLVLRRGDHGIDLARERGLDRQRRKTRARRVRRRRGGAEVERGRIRLRAVEHVDASSDQSASPILHDRADDGSMPQARRVARVPRIADHDRAAGLAHGRIERGLEADLRPDAGRVAGRDAIFDLAQACAGARITPTASATRGSRPARPGRRPNGWRDPRPSTRTCAS